MMKKLVTQERRNGSHIVIQGHIGPHRTDDVFPAGVVSRLLGGQPVSVGRDLVVVASSAHQDAHRAPLPAGC